MIGPRNGNVARWLWYGNAAMVALAGIVAVAGLWGLRGPDTSAMAPMGAGAEEAASATSESGEGGDSALLAAAKGFSRRWEPPTGSVKVSFGPEETVAQGGWRVDGGGWQRSGATQGNIPTGSHRVEFRPVEGWEAPADAAVTVERKKTAELTGTYQPPPPSGRLTVTLWPEAAVQEQAQWRVGEGGWQASGATLERVPVGTRKVQFKALFWWESPAEQSVEIVEDETTEIEAEYVEKPTGSLKVTLAPAEGVAAGAQWRVGQGEWRASGASVERMLAGGCTIEYKPLEAWAAPAAQQVDIPADQTLEITARYVEKPKGSLQVALAPARVIKAQAQWRVGEGAWQESGARVAGLLVGKYTVSFKEVAGWATPGATEVEIKANETTEATVEYARVRPPAPPFTVDTTLVVGQGGLAWLQVPGKKDLMVVAVGDMVNEYRVSGIGNGFVAFDRDDFDYRLEVVFKPRPAAPSVPAAPAGSRPGGAPGAPGAAPPGSVPPRPSAPPRTSVPAGPTPAP